MKLTLKAWRAVAGMTQTELATAIGYATKTPIVHWERGSATPRPLVVEKIAAAIGCNPDDIIFTGDTTERG